MTSPRISQKGQLAGNESIIFFNNFHINSAYLRVRMVFSVTNVDMCARISNVSLSFSSPMSKTFVNFFWRNVPAGWPGSTAGAEPVDICRGKLGDQTRKIIREILQLTQVDSEEKVRRNLIRKSSRENSESNEEDISTHYAIAHYLHEQDGFSSTLGIHSPRSDEIFHLRNFAIRVANS